MTSQEGKTLVIEAADTGDARAGITGSGDYVLMLGSETYVVQDKAGSPSVARIADIAAAMDGVVPTLFKDLFNAAASGAPSKLVIAKGGPRTVAGVPGTVYRIKGLESEHPAQAETFVVSSDPALAPIGRAYSRFIESTLVLMSGLIGSISEEMVAQNRQIAALGTPLIAAEAGELKAIEPNVTLDPARFNLPAAPRSVESIRAEFKASMMTPQ